MTSPKSRYVLSVLTISSLGTTLVSILATWVVSSLAFAPIVLPPGADQPLSGRHFQISPIPPGADWTS
jgi:hypothetical protein